MQSKRQNNPSGFSWTDQEGVIAITTVLIISGVVLLLVGVAFSQSISYSHSSGSQRAGAKALSLAEACMEDALLKLREDQSYSGNERVEVGSDSTCWILAVEKTGGQSRIVKTKASSSEHLKRIKVELTQVNPTLKVGSWREVTGF